MHKIKTAYDVFLSYPADLASQAEVVAKKFTDAGLSVFGPSKIDLGDNIMDEAWQALAISWAVVAIIKPDTMPPTVAVEIGGAAAWHKSIFICLEGQGEYHIPDYFSKYEVFQLSEIDKVLENIKKRLSPLTQADLNNLKSAYVDLGIPTDQLLMQANYRDKLNRELKRKYNLHLSDERIMQELIRLRKSGKLPSISKSKTHDK